MFAVFIIAACGKSDHESEGTVLVEVGNKKISVKEFVQRSELTIRPDNFKSKNITLNNLISEKILALEAQKEDDYVNNNILQGRLRGIKEQMMRDRLYEEVALKAVMLDSNTIMDSFQASKREYELEFFTINNKKLAEKIQSALNSDPEMSATIFRDVENILAKRPLRKVKFDDPDDDVIFESLFTKPLDKDVVLGPLKLTNGQYIVMKVINWIDYPLISAEENQVRRNEVIEKKQQISARKLWKSYQANLMSGKKIEFNEDSFHTLAEVAWNRYQKDGQIDKIKNQIPEINPVETDIPGDAPFFIVDGETWTVEDFKNEVNAHPLVYRTKYLNADNFKQQFKMAVIDLVRDHYLNREAYNRSLDDSENIHNTVELWRDAFLAENQKKNIIKSAIDNGIIDPDDSHGIQKYWTDHIFELHKSYSSSVYINEQEFDKITLTNIDYFAVRPGVPFPVALPPFPVIIASGDLDYTNVMN